MGSLCHRAIQGSIPTTLSVTTYSTPGREKESKLSFTNLTLMEYLPGKRFLRILFGLSKYRIFNLYLEEKICFRHFRCSESSESDWVEVSNCNIGLADPRLGRFCGTMGEGEILAFNSQGRFLRVTFKSNGVYNGLGFNATYEFGKYYSNVDMILI